MSLASVRLLAAAVCVVGIGGMIVTSITGHNGAAVTFGLFTAVAVLCSMVAKAVNADALRRAGGGGASGAGPAVEQPAPEVLAAVVERQVQAMVAAGADEQALRQLVGEAVRLGRTLTTS